jgi:hypothetical protein
VKNCARRGSKKPNWRENSGEAMARAIWAKYLQTASVKRPQRHSAYEGAAIFKEK